MSYVSVSSLKRKLHVMVQRNKEFTLFLVKFERKTLNYRLNMLRVQVNGKANDARRDLEIASDVDEPEDTNEHCRRSCDGLSCVWHRTHCSRHRTHCSVLPIRNRCRGSKTRTSQGLSQSPMTIAQLAEKWITS